MHIGWQERWAWSRFKCPISSSARDGHVLCVARRVHGGRSTQVWDVEVTHAESGKALALFRCTQMLLAARA